MVIRLLRNVILPWLALATLGCHTIDAAHRLVRPSPITAVSVEPDGNRTQWVIEYREPPGGPDDFLHGMIVRGVSSHGHFDLNPVTTCVTWVDGNETQATPIRERVALLRTFPVRLQIPPVSEVPLPESCEHELRVRLSETSRYKEARSIVVRSRSPSAPFEVELPRERPLLEPARWGWLFAGPVLDAVTIVAVPPVVLFLVVADATHVDW